MKMAIAFKFLKIGGGRKAMNRKSDEKYETKNPIRTELTVISSDLKGLVALNLTCSVFDN